MISDAPIWQPCDRRRTLCPPRQFLVSAARPPALRWRSDSHSHVTTTISTAKDFPRGSDVPAAIERNRLLLEAPDGSVVTAKIVRREKQPAGESRNGSGD